MHSPVRVHCAVHQHSSGSYVVFISLDGDTPTPCINPNGAYYFSVHVHFGGRPRESACIIHHGFALDSGAVRLITHSVLVTDGSCRRACTNPDHAAFRAERLAHLSGCVNENKKIAS